MARVYISSTYGDLRKYRAAIAQDLRRQGHTDVAMENYGAEERSSLERCLADVASCDIYVGIFAWRYGWIPERNNPDRRSITELEYRQAAATGKSCLIFLIDEAAPWPFADVETERLPEIRRLRAELGESHNPELFRSGEDLRVAVMGAVARQLAKSAALDTREPIYSIDEKIRLLDGLVLINERAAGEWPLLMVTATLFPLPLIPFVLASVSNFGWPLSISLSGLTLVFCLILGVLAKRFHDQRTIRAAEELNRLRFHRSLYEQYGRDPALADPGLLREAEQAVVTYIRQVAEKK